MFLNKYEKKSFYRFISVYVIASFLVVGSYTYIYYTNQKKSLYNKIFNELRICAMKISSSAVDAQMFNKPFKIPKGVKYQLFDKNRHLIEGNFKTKVNLDKEFYIDKGNSAVFVDKSARGHLGIHYIAVCEANFKKYLNELFYKSIAIFFTAVIFLMIVGWYLGGLFLKPMKEHIQMLDRFIKDSTHEINTPISSIALATQKLEKNEIKPIYLKTIKMNAKLISKIYQDLSFLSFDKHTKNDIKEIDIKSILEKSIEFFEILFEQKNLQLKTNLQSCTVKADPNHLEILFKNLIDNAIKYSYKNKTIEVSLNKCRFCITNDGYEIDKKTKEKIFQRYQRGNNSEGGFGIGLNIVLNICKRYDFDIDLDSEDGKTTFCISF